MSQIQLLCHDLPGKLFSELTYIAAGATTVTVIATYCSVVTRDLAAAHGYLYQPTLISIVECSTLA